MTGRKRRTISEEQFFAATFGKCVGASKVIQRIGNQLFETRINGPTDAANYVARAQAELRERTAAYKSGRKSGRGPRRRKELIDEIVKLREKRIAWKNIPRQLALINPAWKITPEAARIAYRRAKKKRTS